MSESFKFKYEVIKMLRDNILAGLASFGLPILSDTEKDGWGCVESEQQSFKHENKVVAFFLENVERIGWQGGRDEYDKERKVYNQIQQWIEQQTWKIRVILRRTTEPVTAETVTTNDVAAMLIAWFNRLGCAEFRKHYCSNLFVQMKDLRTYKGTSDASQWVSEFPLKLLVPKAFAAEMPSAIPELRGIIGIK